MSESTPTDKQPARPTAFAGRTPKVGDLVSGTIVKITGNVAFVAYGGRSEGYIELGELRDASGAVTVAEGDTIQAEVVNVRGAVRLSARKAQAVKVMDDLREAWKSGTPVEGRIVAVNKGGFEVRVSGVRAFCPLSQISEHFPREPAREVGKTYTFKITEFGDNGKSLVVSRRVVLEAQKKALRETLNDRVKVGERLQGKVTRVKDFGVFVELEEGIEGLIHVSEISHERVGHPREKFSDGDAVEVQVIRIDVERGRIGLSTKVLEDSPWKSFVAELKVGQTLTGTVDRIQPFGVFVKLADGVDGLMHVSGISAERRIEHPSEVLSEGDEVEVVVEKIERDRQRIGLVSPAVAEKRKPVQITVKNGDVVKGTVQKVERFGVFLDIGDNQVGLVPNNEMDTDRGADHSRMFPVGTEIEAVVTEVDRKRGRIRLSRKALKSARERKALDDYRKREAAPKSLGSFGDLLKDFLDKQS